MHPPEAGGWRLKQNPSSSSLIGKVSSSSPRCSGVSWLKEAILETEGYAKFNSNSSLGWLVRRTDHAQEVVFEILLLQDGN